MPISIVEQIKVSQQSQLLLRPFASQYIKSLHSSGIFAQTFIIATQALLKTLRINKGSTVHFPDIDSSCHKQIYAVRVVNCEK